jgi:hypothetical protein
MIGSDELIVFLEQIEEQFGLQGEAEVKKLAVGGEGQPRHEQAPPRTRPATNSRDKRDRRDRRGGTVRHKAHG